MIQATNNAEMENTWSQRFRDQTRAIKKICWLSDLELDDIFRMIEAKNKIANENIEDVVENQTEMVIVKTSERNEQIVNDSDETVNNVAANVDTLDEETQPIIDELNKILAGGRNIDDISFKKLI